VFKAGYGSVNNDVRSVYPLSVFFRRIFTRRRFLGGEDVSERFGIEHNIVTKFT